MLDSGLQDQGADGLPRHLHEDTRGAGGPHSAALEVEPPTSHNRHPHPHTRQKPRTHHTPVIPGPPQMSFRAKPRNLNRSYTVPNFPNGPPPVIRPGITALP